MYCLVPNCFEAKFSILLNNLALPLNTDIYHIVLNHTKSIHFEFPYHLAFTLITEIVVFIIRLAIVCKVWNKIIVSGVNCFYTITVYVWIYMYW